MNYSKRKAPGQCPVCGEKLSITKLSCPNCSTGIEGEFQPCEFCRLPKQELDFIKVFIKCRGSIKDVGRELGISYPTVRSRLDIVMKSLGFTVDSKEDVVRRQVVEARKDKAKNKILDMVSQGKISAKEAAEKIKQL